VTSPNTTVSDETCPLARAVPWFTASALTVDSSSEAPAMLESAEQPERKNKAAEIATNAVAVNNGVARSSVFMMNSFSKGYPSFTVLIYPQGFIMSNILFLLK
jgi:hypothetical protein